MKIGIDCRLWNESGVGRYIRSLVKQLQLIDKKNQYLLFILTKDRKEILKQVQNDNFRVLNADIRWHTFEEQLRLKSIINKENLDLMHFTYYSVPVFYNKPFVVTIHDLILHHFPTGEASTLPLPLYRLKLLGYKFVIKRAAQNAAKIIAVSNATKKEIVDHLKVSEGKVVVTYEGIGGEITNSKSPHFVKATRGKQITNKFGILNAKYFLYVGNAYPHKNLDRLIQALNILISEYPHILLVLVGKQDYFYKRLKEKVKDMGLEKNVKFLGEVSDEELVSLYRNAKALVMPSLMEGFGLPALEAMANKCLVLASDIPTLREICGDCAVYFNPYNIEDIAQIMKTIHSNDINRYSDNILKGYARAKMFSWQKMAEDTLKIYEEMASNPQV